MRKTARLPFAGTYNTRPGATFSGAGFDHRLLNCFQVTQTDRISGTKKLQILKRAGFVDAATPAAGNIGSAIEVWGGHGSGDKIMSCFGATNSTLYDSTTSKGALTGKARGITETMISGLPTLAIATSDSTGWYYDNFIGSVTKITDGDFPGNAGRTTVGNFAQLGGFLFIMETEGRIYSSDLNSVTAWTAAAYLTANAVPDVGIGVVGYRDVIIAFSRSHIEVLRNAGNAAGSPLARVDSMTQLIGALSADAITTCLDKIYFAGGSGANIGIYVYDGGLRKISTPEVEGGTTLSSATMSLTSAAMHGRHFVVVNGSFTSMVFCIEEETWHEWTNATAHLWYKASSVGVAASVITYAVSNSSTSGKIYALNPATIVYADSGTAVTSTIQTANWDGGTKKRKFLHKLTVVGDRKTSAENISIQWTDDDFVTLSTARTVDLSQTIPNLTCCGSFFRRAFVLTHSAATALRIEALELEYDEVED